MAAAVVGATVWLVSLPVSAEAPSGWTQIARDGFDRRLGGGWGSAELGGAYTVSGSASSVGTAGSVGYAKLAAGKSFTATLKGISAGDVHIADTFTMASGPTSYDLFHGWKVRAQSDGSGYTARVRLGTEWQADARHRTGAGQHEHLARRRSRCPSALRPAPRSGASSRSPEHRPS